MFFPAARRDGLTVRELTDETIVYDLERHKVHCLNRTAGLVWKHCDGQTTVAELAAMLKADQSVVHLALEQLGRRKLLQEAMPAVSETARRSRRDVLKQLVAVAALPVVLTIAAKCAHAQSSEEISPLAGSPCSIGCMTGFFDDLGVCIATTPAPNTNCQGKANNTQCCINGKSGICLGGGCSP